jgi:hypothetical protein
MSVVYFMRLARKRLIKIGCTQDLMYRKRELERHYGRKLFILGTIPGDFDDEQWVHEKFAHLRVEKGWKGAAQELFHSAPDLLEFINSGGPILTESVRFHINFIYHVNELNKRRRTFVRSSAIEQNLPIADHINNIFRSAIDRNIGKINRMVRDEIDREWKRKKGDTIPKVIEQPLFVWAAAAAAE